MKLDTSNIIVFLGPPGSGKGTLSRLCVNRLAWTQFSTGDLCREHITNKTELGKNIDFIIKSGKLISDSLIIKMVEEELEKQFKNQSKVILDGFPRTKEQAVALSDILKASCFNQVKLNIVKLDIPDSDIILRLSKRMICSNKKCQTIYSLSDISLRPKVENICDNCSSNLIKRIDDEIDAILDRLKIYHLHENDIIDFFHNKGHKIITLSVNRPVEDIYQDFLTKLNIN